MTVAEKPDWWNGHADGAHFALRDDISVFIETKSSIITLGWIEDNDFALSFNEPATGHLIDELIQRDQVRAIFCPKYAGEFPGNNPGLAQIFSADYVAPGLAIRHGKYLSIPGPRPMTQWDHNNAHGLYVDEMAADTIELLLQNTNKL